MMWFPKVVSALKEQGAGDIIVLGGGTIPPQDIPALESAGISRSFPPGTPTSVIVDYITEKAAEKRGNN